MPPGNWLGMLEMGVAWHGQRQIGLSVVDHRLLEPIQMELDLFTGAHHPQSEIGSDLVVPAASGMEFAADRTDDFGQPPFYRRMDIFILRRKLEGGVGEFRPHPFQAVDDLLCFLLRKHVCPD